jgi:hypothetical protein
MYKKDFEIKKHEYLELFSKGGKILNFTHVDMDGIGSNIALSKRLHNVVKVEVNYHDVDDRIKNFDLNSYDAVIFSDICPNASLEYLSRFKNVIVLDHHDTALEYHNPVNNVYVYNGISGSKLCFEFVKVLYGENNSTRDIERLIEIINDYDLWIHNDPRSRYFNWLYNRYGSDAFKSRFMQGDIKLLNEEKQFIVDLDTKIRDTFFKLDLFDFEKVNGAMFFTSDYINDLAEMVLKKHNYDFIVIVNPSNMHASVRSVGDFHCGTMLKALGIGGGHNHAGGFRSINQSKLQYNITNIEEYAFRFFKFSRK